MYYPAIYQAIALSSQSSNNWPKHQGPITDLDFMPNTDDLLVSVSSYGEIMMHQKNGRNLRTMELLKDSKYDFRDVYVNPKNGHFYALSRNSYMAVKAGKKITMIPLETIRHPIKIQQLEKSTDLLIIGEKQLALFDTKTNTVKETRNLDFNVTFTNRFGRRHAIWISMSHSRIVLTTNLSSLTIREGCILWSLLTRSSPRRHLSRDASLPLRVPRDRACKPTV